MHWQRLRRHALTLCVPILGLALFAGCLSSWSRLPREGDLHPRITRFAYLEEGRIVSMAVDTEASRRREGSAYVPFGIGVGNLGLDKLTITRESLTLIDEDGQRYAMATIPEYRSLENNPGFDFDLTYGTFVPVYRGRFPNWPEMNLSFFPPPLENRGALARERVQLHKRSFTTGVIYFPHPTGDLVDKRFEIWLDAAELEEPVFVKFRIR